MTQYGSLVNLLSDGTGTKIPTVGDGVTVLGYTDRYPGTVISVSKDAREVVVQEDNAKRVDNNGMSETQKYEYSRNPNGRTWTFTKRQDGKYRQKGSTKGNGQGIRFGERERYYDYSF